MMEKDMELFEALKTRRSVRKYEPDPVPEETLNKIMDAARYAPSWVNLQCWELIIVKDPETKQKLSSTLPDNNPARRAVASAPIVIVALGRKGISGVKKDGAFETKHGDWFMFDVALILHQISLAAWAEGLGTVHVGLFDHDTVAKMMEIPDGLEVVELMPLGKPAVPNKKAPRRKEIHEFIFEEHYPKK